MFCFVQSVYAAGGGASGITAIGHQRFRLASDAARDLIFGQYTNYHKTIILNDKRVILAADIMPRSYDGGMKTRFKTLQYMIQL